MEPADILSEPESMTAVIGKPEAMVTEHSYRVEPEDMVSDRSL